MKTWGKVLIGGGVLVAAIVTYYLVKNKKSNNNSLPEKELSPIAKKILTEASKWLDVHEVADSKGDYTKNQGFDNADFEKKIKAIGWLKGEPYCAAFVKMVFDQIATGNAKTFFSKNLSKHALTCFNNLKKKSDYAEQIDAAESGCLICYDGHIEFCIDTDGKNHKVISANGPKMIDGKEIDGVYQRTREAGKAIGTEPFMGYIRILKLD